jgi:uroporphyrinogen decarboxylase
MSRNLEVEDEIKPVEEAYEEYGDRIAVLGGIDLDFVCQKTPEEIYRRSKEMLERAESRGGYALGTGNSVPDYVPVENYCALLKAGLE